MRKALNVAMCAGLWGHQGDLWHSINMCLALHEVPCNGPVHYSSPRPYSSPCFDFFAPFLTIILPHSGPLWRSTTLSSPHSYDGLSLIKEMARHSMSCYGRKFFLLFTKYSTKKLFNWSLHRNTGYLTNCKEICRKISSCSTFGLIKKEKRKEPTHRTKMPGVSLSLSLSLSLSRMSCLSQSSLSCKGKIQMFIRSETKPLSVCKLLTCFLPCRGHKPDRQQSRRRRRRCNADRGLSPPPPQKKKTPAAIRL